MEELLLSKTWQQQDGELPEAYMVRTDLQFQTWRDMVRKHGHCYMVKFGDNDIRPMWEDQIDSEVLVREITPPTFVPFDCPLCQPYDNFDITVGRYIDRRYLTRVVHPKYPDGFIDKSGVLMKCPCLIKGDKRKWLKFKKMRAPQ